MLFRFLKKTKLTIQKGNRETLAQYLVGDEKDFEDEVANRLLKEGVAYPVHEHGPVIHNGFFQE